MEAQFTDEVLEEIEKFREYTTQYIPFLGFFKLNNEMGSPEWPYLALQTYSLHSLSFDAMSTSFNNPQTSEHQ